MSDLTSIHEQQDAMFVEQGERRAPEVFTSLEEEYAAAHAGAVVYDASGLGRLRLTGKTRAALIDRMSTNDVESLAVGQGAATVLTTPLARIIDRLRVYVRNEDLLALTSPDAQGVISNYFRRNIFFNDDVQVHDASGEMQVMSIYGAQAGVLAAKLVAQEVSDLPRHHWRAVDSGALIARTDPVAGDGYHVLAFDADRLKALWRQALDAGAQPIGERAFELLRIEAGHPRYAAELSEQFIPLEVGLWGDVSFSKGCYTGQEIIARMESRHRLAKQLIGLRSNDVIEAGRAIRVDGSTVGQVTSAASHPRGGWIALGVIKPAQAEPGTRVQVDGESPIEAEVAPLPMS
jgi:aminomethyltransferase